MVGKILRTILILLGIDAFVTACLLGPGGRLSRNLMHKEAIALQVLLFGLSAIFLVIWYYLYDR